MLIHITPVFTMGEREETEFTGRWRVFSEEGDQYGTYHGYQAAKNAALSVDMGHGDTSIKVDASFTDPPVSWVQEAIIHWKTIYFGPFTWHGIRNFSVYLAAERIANIRGDGIGLLPGETKKDRLVRPETIARMVILEADARKQKKEKDHDQDSSG